MNKPIDVLLVIDMQNDFMPGGPLAVPRADTLCAVINRLAKTCANVVLTQDWHPVDHISFADMHPGRSPFEKIRLDYGEQVLWPRHCVQGSPGAELHPDIDATHARALVRKGSRRDTDSYSAFVEADRTTRTGLAGYLREIGANRVYCCGVATDYCVSWSALDAAGAGFDVAVIEDASAPIDRDGSLEAAWLQLASAGVARMGALEALAQMERHVDTRRAAASIF